MKSVTILSVWQYSNQMSPFSSLSWMKKYLVSVCFVRLKLDKRPFFSSSIALMLSWYSVALSTSKPWFWRNAFVHNTCCDASWTPTSLLIVEHVALIFFFLMRLWRNSFQRRSLLLSVHLDQDGCPMARLPTSGLSSGCLCWGEVSRCWLLRPGSWAPIRAFSSCLRLDLSLSSWGT